MTTTTIENPARPEVQAVLLKSHLKLMSLGMKNSGISKKQMLGLAGGVTGKAYKGSQIDQAIADLQSVVDAAKK